MCNNCFRMYTKIHTLREDAIRKLQRKHGTISTVSTGEKGGGGFHELG